MTRRERDEVAARVHELARKRNLSTHSSHAGPAKFPFALARSLR
jgi:hypothetical protein